MFQCTECKREFTNYSSMYSHRHLRHGGKPRITCRACGDKFMTINARNQHFYRVHGSSVQASSDSADSAHVGVGSAVLAATTMRHSS
jgi:DNA-directed RNA polymerase subunit RPC12/RpoP